MKMATVLVIDDDPTIRILISAILDQAGHSATVARDGRAGMTAFEAQPFDLVITDIVMPEQEGIATISAIRRLSRTVPILAISGSYTVGRLGDYLHAAIVLGANAALRKPITADALVQTVERLLNGLAREQPPTASLPPGSPGIAIMPAALPQRDFETI